MIRILIALVLLAVYCLWQNNAIQVTDTEYQSSRVPDEFDGFRIVQIADLHNKEFGTDQKRLLATVDELAPDIIVITGDLIDRRKFDLDTAMAFAGNAVTIAPTYYVSGNHEAWSGRKAEVAERLASAGVVVLDDALADLTREGSTVKLLGLADPSFVSAENEQRIGWSQADETLVAWADLEEFKILLSHRPELFQVYRDFDMDLVFAGHAHGGQFRIPGIGGLYSPNQGILPAYSSGSYSDGGTTMFVSRGLGNSIMPIRINNRPEIVCVTLRSAQ